MSCWKFFHHPNNGSVSFSPKSQDTTQGKYVHFTLVQLFKMKYWKKKTTIFVSPLSVQTSSRAWATTSGSWGGRLCCGQEEFQEGQVRRTSQAEDGWKTWQGAGGGGLQEGWRKGPGARGWPSKDDWWQQKAGSGGLWVEGSLRDAHCTGINTIQYNIRREVFRLSVCQVLSTPPAWILDRCGVESFGWRLCY